MSFLKSLFGGSKTSPIATKEMEGKEYSVYGMYSTNFLVSSNVEERKHPNYPWTEEKQTNFFWMFAGENFVFDGEVGCMRIVLFDVTKELTGIAWMFLYKETADEFLEYNRKWGERPKEVGKLTLNFVNGMPCVEVEKYDGPKGHPRFWSNQAAKDRDAQARGKK